MSDKEGAHEGMAGDDEGTRGGLRFHPERRAQPDAERWERSLPELAVICSVVQAGI
jgi:hypothetical protein